MEYKDLQKKTSQNIDTPKETKMKYADPKKKNSLKIETQKENQKESWNINFRDHSVSRSEKQNLLLENIFIYCSYALIIIKVN